MGVGIRSHALRLLVGHIPIWIDAHILYCCACNSVILCMNMLDAGNKLCKWQHYYYYSYYSAIENVFASPGKDLMGQQDYAV